MALLETNGKSKISVIHRPACTTDTSMLCSDIPIIY